VVIATFRRDPDMVKFVSPTYLTYLCWEAMVAMVE
jgi:hypothetical protein